MEQETKLSWENLPAVVRFPGEFAALMRISVQSAYRWRANKWTPPMASIGNAHMIRRADFLKWLAEFTK